jgi:hypothetical protein
LAQFSNDLRGDQVAPVPFDARQDRSGAIVLELDEY